MISILKSINLIKYNLIMSSTKTELFTYNLNEYEAYLLGYIINNTIIKKNTLGDLDLVIDLSNKTISYKNLLMQLLIKLLDQSLWSSDNSIIYIRSTKIAKNYLYLLNPEYQNNNLEDIYKFNKFPNLYQKNTNNKLFWIFIRGYFEQNGRITFFNNIPKCYLSFSNNEFMNDFLLYVNIPYYHKTIFERSDQYSIEYVSTNCIDFLGFIYKNKTKLLYNKTLYHKFESLINWKNIIKNEKFTLDSCKVYKTDPNAIIPCKGHESDVGYDLTIIKKFKQLTPSTILYDTGIKLNVDYGYYIEIVPRSSLSKSGYILANSIGIIEKSYSGNLLVALTKIDKEMPDLELPFKCCQLIFKPQISLNLIEMKDQTTLEETSRSNGGFGSTNNN